MLVKLSFAVVVTLDHLSGGSSSRNPLPQSSRAARGSSPQKVSGQLGLCGQQERRSQFWICTARYNYLSGEANQGECVRLPAEIGRPSLTEIVIIHGATGGVGSLAVQFAKLRGARVIATARGEAGLQFARRLGADDAVDGQDGDIAAAVRRFRAKASTPFWRPSAQISSRRSTP